MKKSPSKTTVEPVKNVRIKTLTSQFARRAVVVNFVFNQTSVCPTALRRRCVLWTTAAKLLQPASLMGSVVLGKPVNSLSEETQGPV